MHLSPSGVAKGAGLLIQISVVTCDSAATRADVWKYVCEIILEERRPNLLGMSQTDKSFVPPPELSR